MRIFDHRNMVIRFHVVVGLTFALVVLQARLVELTQASANLSGSSQMIVAPSVKPARLPIRIAGPAVNVVVVVVVATAAAERAFWAL